MLWTRTQVGINEQHLFIITAMNLVPYSIYTADKICTVGTRHVGELHIRMTYFLQLSSCKTNMLHAGTFY